VVLGKLLNLSNINFCICNNDGDNGVFFMTDKGETFTRHLAVFEHGGFRHTAVKALPTQN
jgi:hypothetical protein